MRDIFFSIHQDLPREGPGDRASTHRAFQRLTGLTSSSMLLDIGCGPGQQAMDLAELYPGTIVCLDTHRPYLETLRGRRAAAGVADRVRVLQASMFAVPLADRSVDAIWAEGSLYIIGLERGLYAWRRLLKPGGYIAATQLSWLVADIPDEPRAFWARVYPPMTTVEQNLSVARGCGFDIVEHFTLPESAWWEPYYGPMEQRLRSLRVTHHGDDEALAMIESSQEQITLYRRFAAFYGYVFYVLRMTSTRD